MTTTKERLSARTPGSWITRRENQVLNLTALVPFFITRPLAAHARRLGLPRERQPQVSYDQVHATLQSHLVFVERQVPVTAHHQRVVPNRTLPIPAQIPVGATFKQQNQKRETEVVGGEAVAAAAESKIEARSARSNRWSENRRLKAELDWIR